MDLANKDRASSEKPGYAHNISMLTARGFEVKLLF
jgi:hypothetical protein